MPRQHGSFDDAINSGAVIAEYHHNENNDNYTVYVKEAEGTLTPFTNIKKEHLQNLLPKSGVKGKRIEQNWKAPDVYEEEIGAKRKSHAGLSFDECVQDGGRIVDLHRNDRGNYSLHIETSDGTRHAYTNVSAEHLRGVPGFREQ